MGNIRLVSSKGKKHQVQRQQSQRQQVQKSQGTPAKKGRKSKSAGKTLLVIALILVVGFAALVFALGVYIRNLDTVFPNVWADGVELSGLTMEEAVEALIAAGYERNADNISATVRFPDNTSFTIMGNEVGFALDAREAAEAAFQVGRDGSYFENEITFIRAHLERTELSELSRARFDDSIVRGVVSEYTRRFNLALIDGAYSIGSDSITIEVGTGIMPAAEASVLGLMVETLFRALDEQAHLTVDYIPGEAESYDVDLQMLYDIISVEPVSAVYDPATFSATQSSNGMTFDMDAAEVKLSNAGRGDVIVIPLVVLQPEMSTEELNGMLFRDVLSERSTNVAGTAARRHNVALSASYINEIKLNPGQIFSFNETVGRRTEARGFRPAGAFVNGRLVDQPGGGICQTSSTLYYAALIANLAIVERHEHGLTVGYIPLGHDATVAWATNKDFRIRNNRDFPIMLEIVMENNRLTARIIGTRVDDYTFTTDFVVLSQTPIEVITQEDESVPYGERRVDLDGSTGFVVEVFVSKLDADENVVDRWSVGRSRYRMQNRIILVPPASASAEGPAEQPPTEQAPPDEGASEPPDTQELPVEPPVNQQPQEPPAQEQPAEPPAEQSSEEIAGEPPGM